MDKTFEKILISILALLLIMIVGLTFFEELSGPKVAAVAVPDLQNNDQNWEIDFNKLMDRKSVEENLEINPAMEMKYYWQGKTLVLEPQEAWHVSTDYQLLLKEEAKDEQGRNLNSDFVSEFPALRLGIIYVGTDGEEQNKIIVRDQDGEKLKEYLSGNFLIKKFLVSQGEEEIILLAKNLEENEGKFEVWRLDLQTEGMSKLFDGVGYENADINFSNTLKYLIVSRIEVKDGQYLSKNQLWLAKRADDKWGALVKLDDAAGSQGLFSPNDAYLIALNAEDNYQLLDLNDLNAPKQFIGKFRKAWDFHPQKALILLDKFVDQTTLNSGLALFDGNGQMEELNVPVGQINLARFSEDGKYIWIFMEEQSEVEAQLNAGKSIIYRYELALKKLEKINESELVSFDDGDFSIDGRFMLLEKIDKLEDGALGVKYRNIQIDLDGQANGVGLAWLNLESGEIKDFDWRGYNLRFIYE
ncbi:MAG: Ig-like domain-containing protein [Candidatus Altimarinota bacterium]